MNLTKVELLWSRRCPFACTGCAMPTFDKEHLGTPEEWARGMLNVAALGSQFVAVYGAEPLTRKEGLIELFRSIYDAGMKATIITALPKDPFLLRLLRETPLDSLTVSWDGVFHDHDRALKSRTGQEVLRQYDFVKDRACVATVTNLNAHLIPEMARISNEAGYWFLFDLLHGSSGRWSKCTDALALTPTGPQVREMAVELLKLKEQGARIHCSAEYLKTLLMGYNGNPRKFWHCHNRKAGWLTVDSDGEVMPCDDWQKPLGLKVWEPLDGALLEGWKNDAVADCPGCAWNTHWDAVAIEEQIIELGTYIHAR